MRARNVPNFFHFALKRKQKSKCKLFKIPDPKIKAHVQNFLDQNNHHYSDSDSQASPRINQKLRSAAAQQQQLQQQRMNAAIDPTLCRPSRIPTIIRSPVHAPKSSNAQQQQHQQQQQQQKQSQLVTTTTAAPTNGSASTNNVGTCFDEPAKKSGFEAYMMTGDLILNLSRTQQSTGLITSQSKKVRHSRHYH